MTNETMPRHIWMHEVETAAIARGVDVAAIRSDMRERLNRWYNAGEPVWMAADGLRQWSISVRACEAEVRDRSVETLRAAHRASIRQEGGTP